MTNNTAHDFKEFLESYKAWDEFIKAITERTITWKAFVDIKNQYGWETAFEDGKTFWHSDSPRRDWKGLDRLWREKMQDSNDDDMFTYIGESDGVLMNGEDYKVICIGNVYTVITEHENIRAGVVGKVNFVSLFTKAKPTPIAGRACEPSTKYMVSVVGGQAPKKLHDCPALADSEARRIASQPKNLGKDVYVLEVKRTYKSKVVLEAS